MKKVLKIAIFLTGTIRGDTQHADRLMDKGKILTKTINLPAEMISEVMIASKNKDVTFSDMVNAYQYPIDYYVKAEDIKRNEKKIEYDFLANGKTLGVESRWRYRLTNCQREETCGKLI